MLYQAFFWSGYGIGEIWSHTIQTHRLGVNANNDVEAIERIEKKRHSLTRYNSCYSKNVVVIVCKNKMGILWLNDKIINWGDDRVFWGISAFSQDITKEKIFERYYRNNKYYNSFILNEYYHDKKMEYISDYLEVIVKGIYPTAQSVVNYIKNRYPEYVKQLI